MRLAGWCSAPGLGNGEELASSFPSHCYPQAGKQSHSFSLYSHSNGKEVEEHCAGMGSTAEGARKQQPKTCLMLFSSPTIGEGSSFCSSRSMELVLVSSCPAGLAQEKWEQP